MQQSDACDSGFEREGTWVRQQGLLLEVLLSVPAAQEVPIAERSGFIPCHYRPCASASDGRLRDWRASYMVMCSMPSVAIREDRELLLPRPVFTAGNTYSCRR